MAALASPSVQYSQEGQHYQLENADYKCSFCCNFIWEVSNLQQKKISVALQPHTLSFLYTLVRVVDTRCASFYNWYVCAIILYKSTEQETRNVHDLQ